MDKFDKAAEQTRDDKRYIILLGKSGIGKSSLGNLLLGVNKFHTSIVEDKRTKVCQIESTDDMVVMDTPGFFTTLRSDVDVGRSIMDTIRVDKLLIQVYILVLSVDDRLSGDENESVELIKKLFGENVINNMIIVFTGKDSLEDDELEQFQFPNCLPKLPYFILDCRHKKQDDSAEIRREIFSEKYKDLPAVFDAVQVNWASIEQEDRRRKDSQKLDVDGYVDSVQSKLGLAQTDATSEEIMDKFDTAAEQTRDDKRYIILLGKSGIGKSSLGNLLLGVNKFPTSIVEDKRTKECQIESTNDMVVMDTPGFFTTLRSDVDVGRSIIDKIRVDKLLIQVYILVLSVDDRLSGDENESVELIKKMFGENVIKNMIIVFTGKDSLEDDELEQFQYPNCLPKLPYFILDCRRKKQDDSTEIQREIFSEKFEDIPAVFDADQVNWASIEQEDRRRKDSQKLDVDGYVDSVQSKLGLTQTDATGQEIMDKFATVTGKTQDDTRNIILLGKSSLGNLLLGVNKFHTRIVEDKGTKVCQIESTNDMVVMDTPGFFTTLRSDVDVGRSIMDTVDKLLIQVYILVLSVDDRLSGNENESVELTKKLFGENVINNMIIVFTGKDSLEDDELQQFQFPNCLPKRPYFILDCKRKEQDDLTEFRREIFSEKYKDIPVVFDADQVDWASIEQEDRRRKDSQKLDVDGYVDSVQSKLGLTQTDAISQELRAAILGKTGKGKSSLGNSLLGKRIFKSTNSATSMTQQCEMGDAQTSIGRLLVVDTPGLFDTDKPNDETIKELSKCIGLLAPGPHVFILVLSVDRFTQEDMNTVDILKRILGDDTMKHIIVVFTRKDQLEDDDSTVEEFIDSAPEYLKSLLRDVNDRYEFICNRQKNSSHQQDVENVLSLIMTTIQQNGSFYFRQDMFEAIERMIQKEIKERQKKENKSEEEHRHEIRTAIVNDDPSTLSKIIDCVKKILEQACLLLNEFNNTTRLIYRGIHTKNT